MRWVVVATMIATISLAACGGSTDGEATQAPTQLTTSASSTASTESSSAPSSPASPTDGLTGLGATREAWGSAHEPATGFTPGSSLLPLIDGQPKYSAVVGRPGERIFSYTLSFAAGTPLEVVKAEVLRELPSGARFDITDDDEPRCLLMDIRSEEVEAVLDNARPMVGFFSLPDMDTPFTEEDVRSAIFPLAFPDETSDLGMC